jgi:Fe-S cluster assembly protein SufD
VGISPGRNVIDDMLPSVRNCKTAFEQVRRQSSQPLLGGEGGQCAFNGLYLGDRQQLADYHTIVDHTKPRCKSRQAYRGILADEARGVVDAKLIVGSDATKTDATQTNRSLLLSDEARIDSTSRSDMSANDVNYKAALDCPSAQR